MNPTQYLAESAVTASNNFHSDKVDSLLLDEALESLVATVNDSLDPIKKALFYGKDLGPQHDNDVEQYGHIPIHLIDPNADKAVAILHTIIGIITEAGELGELLLAVLRGQKKFDDANFLEELGDGQWYTAMGLRTIEQTFENCFGVNIAKLRKRFPQGFSEFDAQVENRNLPAERVILEGGLTNCETVEQQTRRELARIEAEGNSLHAALRTLEQLNERGPRGLVVTLSGPSGCGKGMAEGALTHLLPFATVKEQKLLFPEPPKQKVDELLNEYENEITGRSQAELKGKQFAIMENWAIIEGRIWGDLRKHPVHGDASDARTSRIIPNADVREFKKGGLVETTNTIYLLGTPG